MSNRLGKSVSKKSTSNSRLPDLVSEHPAITAGVAAAALVPVAAAKGVAKFGSRNGSDHGLTDAVKAPARAAGKAKSKVASQANDKVQEKTDEAGRPRGILKNGLKGAIPFGGDDGGDRDQGGGSDNGVGGIGQGRRMPVQQSVDVAMPIERVYSQWTQFEEWPSFMHRVTRVTQEDPCTISVATKIWGKTKEFTAEVVTQRPDDCVKWRVSSGITHEGVVFFRELSPDLTRVELSLDIEPGSWAEKFARGVRLVKRAVRGDLHRFKAYVEMLDDEATDGWRGSIEEGKVVRKRDSRRSSGQRASSRSQRSRSNGQHPRSSGQRSRTNAPRSRGRNA